MCILVCCVDQNINVKVLLQYKYGSHIYCNSKREIARKKITFLQIIT